MNSTIAGDTSVVQETILSNTSHGLLLTFLTFNLLPSHFLLPLLILTFLLSKARRHPTLINVCISWIITGASSSILLWFGKHEGPEPPFSMCLAQASLVYAMPPLTSLAAFALVFNVWTAARGVRPDPVYAAMRQAILLVTPYIGYLVFVVACLWVGLLEPSAVSRNRRFFYCSIRFSPLSNTLAIFAAIVLFATFILEGWIGVLLWRHWRAFKDRNQLSHFVRVLGFTLYGLLAMSLSLMSITTPSSVVPDMFMSTMGCVVFLIFGTQRDIWQAWFFWVRRSERGFTREIDSDFGKPSVKDVV